MSRTPTTQDISWFLDLFDKGQLNLEPPYQRRSVWSPRDRRYFIDTILNDYPAPPIFLHKTLDENGRSTYHVVDGKQRLQTIIMFRENKLATPDDFSDVTLRKKRWKDLEKATREKFWNYILIVEMLPDTGDAAIRNTFERINRNSRKLTPQEMRHAKYDGWFIQAVEAEAANDDWRRFGVVTAARAKRMADAQFISELFALTIRKSLNGFDQDALDNIYAEFDEIEENELFVEDDFTAQIAKCKESIAAMIDAQIGVSDFLKAQGHFYSLWGILNLERACLPAPTTIAQRYIDFMQVVTDRLANPTEAEGPGDDPYKQAAADYAANIRGASTDLTPRQNRHRALVTALCDPEAS